MANQQPSPSESREGSTTIPQGSRGKRPEVQSTSKVCRICGTEKPLDEFYLRNAETGNRRTECKDCLIELHRYRDYGVCNVKYHEILAQQRGQCAICRSTLNSSRYTKLAVDHCHRTGKVRGLLCTNCNTAIGLMKDSPVRLVAASEYLKRHGSEDIV